MSDSKNIPFYEKYGFKSQQEFDDWNYEDSFNWEPSIDENGNYVPPKYGADEKYAMRSDALGEIFENNNIRKTKSIGIPSSLQCNDDCTAFNFDLDKMEEALKGPFYTIPDGLSVEEIVEWLNMLANNTDEENEQYIAKDPK
jgi:hypothetical protein